MTNEDEVQGIIVITSFVTLVVTLVLCWLVMG